MPTILFVCTGNICRSPMAEYYLKHCVQTQNLQNLAVSSAGIHACAGAEASQNSLIAMQEQGIDISEHRGRQVNSYILSMVDLILVMEQYHKMQLGKNDRRILLLSEFASENRGDDITDPYGSILEDYRLTRDRIIECINGFLRAIRS